jgi:hypothetical protein
MSCWWGTWWHCIDHEGTWSPKHRLQSGSNPSSESLQQCCLADQFVHDQMRMSQSTYAFVGVRFHTLVILCHHSPLSSGCGIIMTSGSRTCCLWGLGSCLLIELSVCEGVRCATTTQFLYVAYVYSGCSVFVSHKHSCEFVWYNCIFILWSNTLCIN